MHYLLDGAMGSELSRRGVDITDRLWSASAVFNAPALIRDIHLDYLSAGADILSTVSYQMSLQGFREAGYSLEDYELAMKASVDIAREARDVFLASRNQNEDVLAPQSPQSRRILVAASLGSYGAILADGSEYRGDFAMDRAGLASFHRQRIETLVTCAAPVDLLAFETIPSIEEARAIVDALRDFPDLRAYISFSCCDGANTSHGEAWADCVSELSSVPQVMYIGVNCTSPEFILSLLQSVRPPSKPLIVYPNRGDRWNAEARAWEPQPLSEFERQLKAWASQWLTSGATIIGGCCRTTPVDIRIMRQSIDAFARRKPPFGVA